MRLVTNKGNDMSEDDKPTDWYAGMTEKHYDIALNRAVAAERERCAKLCARQNWPDDSDSDYLAGCEFAARIRA